MSPSEVGEEEDDFSGSLADFEPPIVRFSPPELKFQQQPSLVQHVEQSFVPPLPVTPDWTCPKAVDPVPRAPELDLSGIEGLDDDSSGGGGSLGRTHYFGDDDDDDKETVELHDQVQSAINSILDFRRSGSDDPAADSKSEARGGSGEPMDFDEATGEAPTDSVLDEAVRSILL